MGIDDPFTYVLPSKSIQFPEQKNEVSKISSLVKKLHLPSPGMPESDSVVDMSTKIVVFSVDSVVVATAKYKY